MKYSCWIAALVLVLSGTALGQNGQVDLQLVVSNGSLSRTLHFGLDPSATDGIDAGLGEREIPPFPPDGVFDARFSINHLISVANQGVIVDYRKGDPGNTTVKEYRIQFHPSAGTTSLVFSWNLPPGVTGTLKDPINGLLVNEPMRGKGSYTHTLLSMTELSMSIAYNSGAIRVDDLAGSNDPARPAVFALQQNFPNPFNPSTQIRFSIPHAAHVTLQVFNIIGQLVATLVDEELSPGSHTVTWNASGVAGGVYIYRLTDGQTVETKRLILLK